LLSVKYEKPLSIIAGIVSRFSPKAKSEFNSAMLLESKGIHCVDYCGRGYSGSETVIFSKELKDSESAYDAWFKRLAFLPSGAAERNLFLENLAIFLKKFFDSGLYHPDLHPGNLLVRRRDMEFFIVDPYGIKDIPGLSAAKSFKMKRIWGAFRGELSEKEAVSLILKSGMADGEISAATLWEKILCAEASEMKTLWEKREKRMRAGKNLKYYYSKETGSGTLFLRKELAEKLPEDIRTLEERFTVANLAGEEAEKLWFMSLYLQFQRLEHVMPVAWLKSRGGASDCIFWENRVNLSEPGPGMENEGKYFEKRCLAAGIIPNKKNVGLDADVSRLIITKMNHLKKR